ncbi:putative Lantibiotic dehydratase domain protein [Sphingobacterium sp. PM2-P1-29]|nr:putative Lantibiotic dehydratase domain protein [Sphingobacterium sp. PM2-P1-29]
MKIHSQLMIRVPQFPYNAKIEDVWDDLIQSIEYASPDFYQKVAHLNPISMWDQSPKIVQTILKYFNRAKFRPTPLGTFSAFGITGLKNEKDANICIRNKRIIHLYTDWKYISQVDYDFQDVLHKNLKLFSNSTYYLVMDAIRYVRRQDETFELAEVSASEEIITILKSLRAPMQISELIESLSGIIEKPQLLNLLEAMILSDLILTEFAPNTLGEDYFTRIGQFNFHTPKPYIISQLSISTGGLPIKYFKHLPNLIQLLAKIHSPDTNAIHMKEFIDRYTIKFDRKNMRVMEALDPQVGVGYGNFSKSKETNSLIDLLTQSKSEKPNKQLRNLKEFFKTGINFGISTTIDLASIPNYLLNDESDNKLPNTLSVIGRIVDEQFLIERIGGHTANQIAGRFSNSSEEALRYSKDIAQIEEDANPDIVFFDLAYHAEYAVDNINRRPNLYGQELNLICYPGIDQPLTLDDLYISISGSSIILRSERLGKRVVPRMASAYNYRRSELPVFRFLYDLAFYGVWPELSFDIKQIIPGLSYYPKVVYKNIVLSLPKLVIYRKDYVSDNEIEMGVKNLLKEYRFGSLIKVLKGEEFAVYNLELKEELALFVTEIKRNERITVEEMVLPNTPLVKDENNNPFINQVIVPVVHNEELYPVSAAVINDSTTTQRDFLPLQEWLYVDIFVHPLFSDRILLDPIQNLLKCYKPFIQKWFFIRYNENGDHLRLRIKANKEYLLELIGFLNKQLQPFFHEGIVQDVKVSSYRRELERYDIVGIDNVESHFHESSMLIFSLLNSEKSDLEKYQHCLRIMNQVQNSMIITEKRFIDWTSFIRKSFEKEHNIEFTKYKTINRYLKDYMKDMSYELSEAEIEFTNSIIALLKHCPERRKAPLFTDLIHMHVNRLFAEQQRSHELICYNLLQQHQLKIKKSF